MSRAMHTRLIVIATAVLTILAAADNSTHSSINLHDLNLGTDVLSLATGSGVREQAMGRFLFPTTVRIMMKSAPTAW